MKNKKTVFKAFVSREKEEVYLNEMNKQGWRLSSVRFAFYTFVKSKPNEYMTVLYFAERQYQTTFVRTVTECGCDIANQTNQGKNILFYINIPVGSENIDFLTDNQSKLDSKKRLNKTRKRELIALFVSFAVSVVPEIHLIPAIIKILKYAPEELYKIIQKEPLGFILLAILLICGTICGIMGVYLLALYSKTKREIKRISNEMKIFE